ncbi:MAG: thioredoxin domain-containing protein [Deltaproteobacteria bacterium]|nr:thioredoxin domain-containing protein [Deltaproteobacteria bacterium]
MRRRSLPFLGVVLLGCATGRVAGTGAGRTGDGGGRSAPHECPCKSRDRRPQAPLDESLPAELDHGKAAVPVTDADPSWGSRDALVTIVVWGDFACPFSSRVGDSVYALKRAFGPAQLRLVWKNYPLAFHVDARPTAEAAMTVFALGGDDAFWRFHDLAFANQRQLSPASFTTWAARAGVDPGRFEVALAERQQAAKLDQDLALAARLGVRGTPYFFINGVPLLGDLPVAAFRAIVDAQIAAARELVAAGTPVRGVYPALCARNQAALAPPSAAPTAVPEDTRIWRVPVDKADPVRGPEDALVTLVLWGDFECPFSRRLQPTLATLMEKYGSDLRVVWKDFPLSFHHQALPAAVLARLHAARKGPDAFWQAHDALMEGRSALDEAGLQAVAGRLGLSWSEVGEAMADGRYRSVFDEAQALAQRLEVRGTPCSFVNGRRIDGALPPEVFAEVIDAELDKARALLEAGQARAGLYAAITSSAEAALDLERRLVDAPTKDNPTRGNAKAAVTIQVFGDFQCPHCQRLMPLLGEIEKKFPRQVRLVWRHRPLAFHDDAALAAEAAQEVYVQKGAAAFWRYHDLLFAAQSEAGLGRANLEKLVRKLGVDRRRFRAALKLHRHRRVVARDVEAAKKAEIFDVPAVLVNDYLISGVEGLSAYEQAVARALDEAKRRQHVPENAY